MRTIKLLLLSLGLAVVACAMQSCLDDNDHYYNIVMPNALVTVKPAAGNTGFYLQLDVSTTLKPVNMSQSPFGNRQVRALVNYSTADQDPAPYKQAVRINWIDSILTKPLAKDLGDDNPATYGNDPVEIVNDWVTIAEDGYLTLRVRTLMSGQVKHIVNLVATPTADNAYVVTFYQVEQLQWRKTSHLQVLLAQGRHCGYKPARPALLQVGEINNYHNNATGAKSFFLPKAKTCVPHCQPSSITFSCTWCKKMFLGVSTKNSKFANEKTLQQ